MGPGANTPLIDFNTLIDTDFGLILLIDREYLDSEVFSIDWFKNHHKINILVNALLEREHPNPLMLCMKEDMENKESEANKLYKEFVSNEETYKKILNYSMCTEYFNVVDKFKVVGDIFPCIVCKNDMEIDTLNEFDSYKNIKKEKLFNVNKELLRSHDQFIIKDIRNPLMDMIVEHTTERCIYLANYKFNDVELLGEKERELSFNLIKKRFDIKSMDLYSIAKLKESLEDNSDG